MSRESRHRPHRSRYAPQYEERLNGFPDHGDENPCGHTIPQPRPDWSVPQPTQKWYTEEVSGRTREYSGLRRDIQRRDTETRYVERLGDKTRVITQSQKHAPTIQPAGTFITPQLRHSAPNALYTRERPLPASQPCVEIRNAVPEYIIYNDESSHEDSVSDAGSDVSFTFDLSFHKTRPKEDDHGVTISGSSDKSGNREPEKATSSVENKPNSYNETPYRVLRSRYNGDIYARGDTVAELTTEPNQESSKRVPLPLLRWIHLESQYPSLASFLEYVLRTHRLDEDERQDAIALLERTRETYEKPILTPEGTKGKYLEPHFAEENVYNRRLKVKKERSAQLLCIPYFCLAPYLTHSLSHASQLHPMRTLLQSSYSSAPKKRDLQQAVCRLDYPLKGHCFHVPQIWSLVLNNSLLITCARLSASEIQRGLINNQLLPCSREHKKSFDLHVSDGGSRTWLLPAEDCTTWLEFTANFKDLSIEFDDDYEVVYKGIVRRVDDWVAVIAQAKETTIYLSLRNKRKNRIIYNSPFGSEAEDEESASVSSTNSDSRNNSSEIPGHNSAGKDGSKPSSKSFSDPTAYDDESSIWSQQDNTSPARNTPRTKPPGAPKPGSTPTNSRSKIQASLNNFHLFLWLTAVSEKADSPGVNAGNGSKSDIDVKSMRHTDSIGRSFDVNTDRLDNLFSDMQRFIYSAKFKKRRAYKRCPSHTLQEVEARLARIEQEEDEEGRKGKEEPRGRESNDRESRRDRESLGRESRSRRRVYSLSSERINHEIERHERRWRKREVTEQEQYDIREGSPGRQRTKACKHKKEFVRTAKQLFQFFLPLHYTSDMIMKYWGAVYYLIEDDERFQDRCEQFQWTATPSSTGRLMKIIAYNLSQGRGPLPWNIALPNEFGKSWLHLLMSFVLRTEHSQDWMLAGEELRRCYELVSKGRKVLMRNVVNTSLQEKEAALPLGIMSLIVRKLMEDVTVGQRDVCSTYYEYLQRLEQEVQVNPYSRAHQEKISFLQQEIECILNVMKDQLSCLTNLHSKVGQGAIVTPARFPREREFYILHECICSVKAKIQSFTEMAGLASDLGEFNIRRIESNKDRQEAAILVFTIVTIIFLPLSFVSSFFGMNTADIRSMETPQWLFWTCAIPLTVVVLGLALLVAHKIESAHQVWSTFLNRWTSVGPDTSDYPAPMAQQQSRPELAAAYPPLQQWPGYEEPVPLRRRVKRQL